MKREIKKLVIELFPRDSDGVILSESAETPSQRRSAWFMDELYRALSIDWNKGDAGKCMKFAVAYVKRERRRQIRVVSSNTDASPEDIEEL